MKEKVKVPELRFDGFTDDWEEHKLGEYVNFLNGRAYKQSELLDKGKYKVVRVGNFNTNDRWYYSDLELDQNKYAQKGDLLYLWATNFGPEIWSEEKVIYHYHIWKLELLNNNLDKQYLYTWLVTDKERIKQNTNGTTMVHVTKGNMEQRDFQFPGLNEQQKIGSFFKQLDNTIALHQRKLDLLKEQKKGYLQKMFPKNGEKVPELRFAGFADDWEDRKLTNITSSYSGLTYSPTDIQDTGTFVLRSSNVKNNQLIDADNVYVNPDIVNSNNVKVGDVIVVVRNGSRSLIGKHAIVNEEMPNTVIGAFMSAFRGENGNYINALLSTDNFQKEVHKSLGATINQITGKDFSMMIFPTPKFGEQQKIGAFFKQLDDTIALHQRKLDLLKEQKKNFLQKMFV